MTDARRCANVGELVVGGKVVGLIRCELDAGHEHEAAAEVEFGVTWEPKIEATPHRATLEWTDPAAIDWPEANDPDEAFDVDPMTTTDDEREPFPMPHDYSGRVGRCRRCGVTRVEGTEVSCDPMKRAVDFDPAPNDRAPMFGGSDDDGL